MPDPDRRARGRRGAVAAVALGVFCIQLDSFALNLALPDIARDLGASGSDVRWTVSAYLLAVGTLMLGAGRFADRFGRRRLLITGVAAFSAGSLACALAPTLPALVAFRVLQGAGGAMTMPAGLALLTNVHPPALRGRATGLALGLGGVATALGPFVGGALTDAVSWRAIFWVNVPITAAAVLALRPTGESRDTGGSRTLDGRGLLLAAAGLGCLTAGVDQGLTADGSATTAAGSLAATSVLAIAFVRHERRTRAPLVDPGLFTERGFTALTLSGAAANVVTVVFLLVVPLSLRGYWGVGATTAGLLFLAPSALMAVAGPVAGRVPTRRATTVMAGSLAVCGAALVAAAHAPALPAYVAAVAVCGAGLGVANALTLVATLGMVDPARAGAASGVTKTVVTVAAGLGVVLVGTPAAGPGVRADTGVLDVLAVLAAGTAGLLLAARASRPARTPPAPRPP